MYCIIGSNERIRRGCPIINVLTQTVLKYSYCKHIKINTYLTKQIVKMHVFYNLLYESICKINY